MLLLVNMFVLSSVVCVLLNLAGFILCCQGAQLVSTITNCQLSEVGDVCNCCPQTPTAKCPEEKLLKLYPGHSCSTMRVLLKKVLFALCALNALTTAVCLVAAALRYLQVFTTRRPCMDYPRPIAEEVEEPTIIPDPDEFVPPAPPPSYFSTFYSYTPRLARRMFGDSVIPLPHIYGARIKGLEVFCPLDPPPPYEAVTGGSALATATQTLVPRQLLLQCPRLRHLTPLPHHPPGSRSDSPRVPRCPPSGGLSARGSCAPTVTPYYWTWLPKVITVSERAAIPQSLSLPRPRSRPSAALLDCSSQTLPQPLRKRPGLLHLGSCGDLSTFTWAEQQPLEARQGGGSGSRSWSRAGSRVGSRVGSRSTSRVGSRLDHHERPHSLIRVFRETVL
uniref:Endosomal transmembrane epsin interactor 1 n=1 Tax=Hucho hucho TaxID=62062 RepID=A0A4W5KSG4_9TELE